MKKTRDTPLTWLMPLATTVQFFLPRWLVLPIARVAGLIAYRRNHRQRARVLENLSHVLGPGVTAARKEALARRTFVNLVVAYLDTLRAPVLKKRVVRLARPDPAPLDEALREGRGAVLVTGHIGNWDLAAVFLTAQGYSVSAVVEPIPAGWTRTFNRYRCLTGMEAIPIPDRQALVKAIRRKRVVTLVADRDLTGNGLLCPAFDAFRSFPRGPAAYALKYDLPVVIGYFVFDGRPGNPPYLACLDQPMRFALTGDLTADIEIATRRIARRLNEIIEQYPDQWFAFRAGWQTAPRGN